MQSSPRNTSKDLDVSVTVKLRRLDGGWERGPTKSATGRQSTITSSTCIMDGEDTTTSGNK